MIKVFFDSFILDFNLSILEKPLKKITKVSEKTVESDSSTVPMGSNVDSSDSESLVAKELKELDRKL